MMTVISVAGIVLAALVFLHLLQAKDTIDHGGKSAVRSQQEQLDRRREKVNAMLRSASTRRTCPVCRTPLTTNEYLICAMEPESEEDRRRQVHIFGCLHCFSTDGVNVNQYEMVQEF